MKLFAVLLFAIWSVGSHLPFLPAEYKAAPAPLEEYAGTYQLRNNENFSNFVVKVQDGALYGEADSYGSNKLLPQDQPDVFKSTSQYGSIITFKRDPATKKVVGLVLHLMDTDFAAERKE